MSENSGYPSMAALLGLLAIAGYQNRDKLSEWFGGGQASPAGGQGQTSQPPVRGPGSDGAYDDFRNAAGAGGIGGAIAGGIGELVDRFRQIGKGDTADSWIGPGQNQGCDKSDLERALGPDGIDMLVRRTGLSRDELLSRLCRDLPDAVDRYTPEGRLATS